MTHELTPEGTPAETGKKQQSNLLDAAEPSPVDKWVAGMTRTLEEIQRDPLLHHRLSQRGF